jgi:hypothetical protein
MYAIVKSPRDPIFTETAFAPRESADDFTMASASSPFTGGTPTNLGRID